MKSVDLGQGKVSSVFAKYAIPSVLIMVTQTIAMMVDAIFVGQYVGPEGLSAVTLFYPLVSLFIGLATMVAVGSNNLAGISLGNGNFTKSNDYFNIATRAIVVFSLVLTLVGVFIMGGLTEVLNVEGLTKQFVMDYGKTISLFFVFFMMNLLLSYFVKLEGQPKLLMRIAIISVVANIMLDYVLIALLGWKLVGAAIATGMSQVIYFVFLLYYYAKNSKWHLHHKRLSLREYGKVCVNGSPQFLTEAAYAITGFVINSTILSFFGVKGIAGYSVAMQLTALFRAVGLGVSEASRPGVSFNFGASDYKRVSLFKKWADGTNLIFGLVCFLVLNFFGGQLAKLFVQDQGTINQAVEILKVISISYVVMGFNIGVKVYYSAIHAPKFAMAFTLYRCLFAILGGLLVFTHFFGGQGIWYALLFKEFSATMIALLFYRYYPSGENSSIRQKMIALR